MVRSKTASNIPFNIKKFNMSKVPDNKIMIFIGKRGTGKSVLITDYLYHHRNFPICTVVSPTDSFNNTYSPHVPALFIHDKYTPELLENIMDRQKKICRQCLHNPDYKSVDPRTLVIFDDCLADGKQWTQDENVKWIFMNGRHVKMTFMLALQYCMGIPPNLRTNVDYIFICKEPKITNQKRLYEQFAGMFPSFEFFRETLNKCTKDYGCLVIDNASNSDRLEDQVFWYRCNPNLPDWDTFRLCYQIFWKDNDSYDNNEVEKEEEKDDEDDDWKRYSTKRDKYSYKIKQVT